jgi:hypothetical protein
MTYKKNNNIVSKLPADSGYATVGYHLPISSNGTDVIAQLDKDQLTKHRQIDQLPYRYRFPFFTDRKDGIVLEDYAYYALSDQLGRWGKNRADYVGLATDDWSYGRVGGSQQETQWIKLLKIEASVFSGINTTDNANMQNMNDVGVALKFNLSSTISFNNVLEDASSYIYSEKNKTTGNNPIVRMPYPDAQSDNPDVLMQADGEYAITKTTFAQTNNAASMMEWGSPSTAAEEQFYIAMRWPYKPGQGADERTVEQLKHIHGITDVYGTVQDYKSRRVLVYSPTTGQAVVCKPAYFLWGKEDVGVLDMGSSEKDGITGWDPTTYLDTAAGIITGDRVGNTNSSGFLANRGNNLGLEDREKLEAIVSPDAAYFLGMLNLTASVNKPLVNSKLSPLILDVNPLSIPVRPTSQVVPAVKQSILKSSG